MNDDTTADRVRDALATVADYAIGPVIVAVRNRLANRPREHTGADARPPRALTHTRP